MLKKVQNITIAAKPDPEVAVAEIPPFEILNAKSDVPEWHLVIGDKLVAEEAAKGTPNIVTNLQNTSDKTCADLKSIGNKVIVFDHDIESEHDLITCLVARKFNVAVNTVLGFQCSYARYLIDFYHDRFPEHEHTGSLITLCEHISYYPNAFEREDIAKDIAKEFKKSKATVLKEINGFISIRDKDTVQHIDDDEFGLPGWLAADKELSEFYWRHGFVFQNSGPNATGIWFSQSNGPKKLTNFILVPLIHIYTKDENGNRRLTELSNGYSKTVLELPGKAFTSMETFDTIITSEGAFFTYDGFTKSHLNKLKAYFLSEYPKCFELNTLGWQPEGFFSFSNLIYKNDIVEYNQYGIAEVDGQNFLSMGASNALEGVRADDDIYKNDKFLRYNPTKLDFRTWCKLMVGVYPEHGMMAITFVIMTTFRDILFKRNNNFPILYFYGPVGSGKSKIAESVVNVFTHTMPMFNLNNGTDYAFFSLLSRFVNVPVGLNEFDENAIKEEWFRAIKGAYDGEGREKGTGRKNKTTSQEIKVGIVLIGQFLSTKDDNSVLSRTLPCKTTEDGNRTPEKLAMYDELKAHEQEGISALVCELLAHRDFVATTYLKRYVTVNSEMKAALTKEGITPKNRILENYSVALTMMSLFSEKVQLGFTYDTFFKYCRTEITKLSSIMNESNSLSQFWKTVEFLLDQGDIETGKHFRIEARTDVRIAVDRKTSTTKQFEEPKKLLFLRLSTIHMLYMKEVRTQTGKAGLNEQTILTYMKDQPAYIGSNPASHFTNSQNTSSYVFDYDQLGVNLERFKEDNTVTATVDGKIFRDAEIRDVMGNVKLCFDVVEDQSYTAENGDQIKKTVITKCFSDKTDLSYRLKRDTPVKVTGSLTENKYNDNLNRRMVVSNIEISEPELFAVESKPDKELIF